MNAITNTTLVNPNDIQDGRAADKWKDKLKLPKGAEITPYQALRAVIEMRKTNVAGEYGFRRLNIVERTSEPRLIIAVTQFSDDHALGVEGVRGERLGIGGSNQAASAGGFTQTQLDALKRYREAVDEIGQINSALLTQAIIYGLSAREIGEKHKHDHKWAIRQVTKAAEKLADYYESPKRPKIVMTEK